MEVGGAKVFLAMPEGGGKIEEKLRTQLLDLRPTMERKYPRTEKRGDAARARPVDYWFLERSEGRAINLSVELCCVPPRAQRSDANFP